jgi:hypothetical protein
LIESAPLERLELIEKLLVEPAGLDLKPCLPQTYADDLRLESKRVAILTSLTQAIQDNSLFAFYQNVLKLVV